MPEVEETLPALSTAARKMLPEVEVTLEPEAIRVKPETVSGEVLSSTREKAEDTVMLPATVVDEATVMVCAEPKVKVRLLYAAPERLPLPEMKETVPLSWLKTEPAL